MLISEQEIRDAKSPNPWVINTGLAGRLLLTETESYLKSTSH